MSKIILYFALFSISLLVISTAEPVVMKHPERRLVVQCKDSPLNDQPMREYLRSEDGSKELIVHKFRCHSA